MNRLCILIFVSVVSLFFGCQKNESNPVTISGPTYFQIQTGGWAIDYLLVSDTSLFAAINGFDVDKDPGIFRSTDNGKTWTAARTGLTTDAILCLVVKSINLFAGTNGYGGLFRSTNNGATWNIDTSGLLPAGRVASLAVNGIDLIAGTDDGIFSSTNDGGSWMRASNGLPADFVDAVAANQMTLFAGTRIHGVYRSTDNGSNWTIVNSGWLDATFACNGTNVLVGTQVGVFRSTDNGTTWSAADTVTGIKIRGVFPINGSYLFGWSGGGVIFTTNDGASWEPVQVSGWEPAVDSTFVPPTLATNSNYLFAGGPNGRVWRHPFPL